MIRVAHAADRTLPVLRIRLVAVILVIVLAWRLMAIATSEVELFYDEAQYWTWSLDLAFGYFSKPPLIAWLIGFEGQVCGDSAFCVRAGSPIIHTVTAVLIGLLARRFYGWQAGLWAAILYISLLGVTFSSRLMTTDVPLLFFWAAALLLLDRMRTGAGWLNAVGLGVAIGLGVLAKYAMLYFLACLVLWLVATPYARGLLVNPRLYLALVIAALVITPNVLWNLENGLVTLEHTAANADWARFDFNWEGTGMFVLTQFLILGPLLFIAYLGQVVQRAPWGDPRTRYLLFFSVPILVLMVAQAFISRAHGNWAAPSFCAATILVAALALKENRKRLILVSLGLGLVWQVTATFVDMGADRYALPVAANPYVRTQGWARIADETARRYREGEFAAVMTRGRRLTATMRHRLRRDPPAIVTWRGDGQPMNYYEMTIPIAFDQRAPILFVTTCNDMKEIEALFERVDFLGQYDAPTVPGDSRRVYFFRLGAPTGAPFPNSECPPEADRKPVPEPVPAT